MSVMFRKCAVARLESAPAEIFKSNRIVTLVKINKDERGLGRGGSHYLKRSIDIYFGSFSPSNRPATGCDEMSFSAAFRFLEATCSWLSRRKFT